MPIQKDNICTLFLGAISISSIPVFGLLGGKWAEPHFRKLSCACNATSPSLITSKAKGDFVKSLSVRECVTMIRTRNLENERSGVGIYTPYLW